MAKAADESLVAFKHFQSDAPLEKVYLFYGEDSFVIEQLTKALENKRFKGEPPDPMSWEMYRAGEIETKKVIDAVLTVSMFGGAKVVIYRDIEKLNESELDRIVQYVKKPVRAHFVLIASKIDARRKSWTEIKKNAFAVSCAPLNDRNVTEYVRSLAGSKKVKMTATAMDALANLIGPNRTLIERAFEKLSLAIPAGTTITPEMVEEHVVDTRERSVFELTKSITRRDIPAALNALRTLIDQKQEPVAINGMLARHARLMLQTKIALSMKMTESDIIAQTGINPYGLKEYLEAAPRYSMAELFQFHADVFEADKSLKSKPVPPELVLSRLLMSLLRH